MILPPKIALYAISTAKPATTPKITALNAKATEAQAQTPNQPQIAPAKTQHSTTLPHITAPHVISTVTLAIILPTV